MYKAEDLVELYSAETNLVSQVQSGSPRCNVRTGVLYWLLKFMVRRSFCGHARQIL